MRKLLFGIYFYVFAALMMLCMLFGLASGQAVISLISAMVAAVSIHFGYEFIGDWIYERRVKKVEKIFDYNSTPREKDE